MRDLTYPPIIAACKLGFRLLGQRIEMAGTHHVPRTGGVMLAVNHVGYVDFVYGGLAANPSGRKVRFMAKRELFDHRWVGPLMRSLHHIEVDRGEGVASFHTAVEYLRAGEAVGIFPEATISRAMELKEFKSGAVRIAAEAGVPLVPVIMWGTQRMMTKDHPRDFSRGKTIAITVGEPLQVDGATSTRATFGAGSLPAGTGVTLTFSVQAVNDVGPSPASAQSNGVRDATTPAGVHEALPHD